VIGGLLVDTLGWRSISVINVPLALISFAVVLRQVSETPTQALRKLDPFGQLTSILAVTALTFRLIEGGVLGWHESLIQAAFGVALICFVAFLFIEARGHAPMLPLRLFGNPTILAGLLAGAMLNFVFSGLLFVLSLFFQQVRSYSPLLIGLAFLPLTLVLTINPTFTGRLVGRFGARIPLTLGFFLAASGVFMQIWTNAHTGYAITLVALVLMGGGFSLTLPSAHRRSDGSRPKGSRGYRFWRTEFEPASRCRTWRCRAGCDPEWESHFSRRDAPGSPGSRDRPRERRLFCPDLRAPHLTRSVSAPSRYGTERRESCSTRRIDQTCFCLSSQNRNTVKGTIQAWKIYG